MSAVPKDDTLKQPHHRGSIFVNGEKYPLPDLVVENIEKVIGLQANQERNVPLHERILAKVADACGRSRFLYFQLMVFASWWVFAAPSRARYQLRQSP